MENREQDSKLNERNDQTNGNAFLQNQEIRDLLELSDEELGRRVRELAVKSGDQSGYRNTVQSKTTVSEEGTEKQTTDSNEQTEKQATDSGKEPVSNRRHRYYQGSLLNDLLFGDHFASTNSLMLLPEFSVRRTDPFGLNLVNRRSRFDSMFGFPSFSDTVDEIFGEDRGEFDENDKKSENFGYSKSMVSRSSINKDGVRTSESVYRTKKNNNGKLEVTEKRVTENENEIITEELRPDGQKIISTKPKKLTIQ